MQLVVLISQTPPEYMCYCNLNNIVFAFVPMHLYSLPDDSPSFSLHHLPLAEQQRLQRLLDPLLRLVKRDGLGEPHQLVRFSLGEANIHPVANLVHQVQVPVGDRHVEPGLRVVLREERLRLCSAASLLPPHFLEHLQEALHGGASRV